MFNGMIFPKFLAYIDEDGFPVIIPVFQARSVERKRIVVPYSQFKKDLQKVPIGAKVSIFVLDFETVSQMIKGIFTHIKKNRMIIDVDFVYNSMPPHMGEIYPNKPKLQKITQFIQNE